MKLSEYVVEAAKTANPNAHLWEHYVLGLGDEVGEIQKIFKRAVAYTQDGNVDYEVLHGKSKSGQPNRDLLVEELGDLMWFISQLCRLYGIDPDAVLEANLRKLQGARYRQGFSESDASNRDLGAEAKALAGK